MIKSLLYSLSKKSSLFDQKNIFSLLEYNPFALLLDLGCGNGKFTKAVAQKIGTKNVTFVDIEQDQPGVIKSDLNKKFPFKNNSYDVIISNQVIEHIQNTDNFISEIKRVLKVGGYAIISTENLSSWHNILALILGLQPFSLDHSHPLSKITVPIAPKHGHVKAFSYFGLKKLLLRFGFKIVSVKPAGYFQIQNLLDPLHCHRLTIKVLKS